MMKKTLKTGGKAVVKLMRGPLVDEVVDAYLTKFNSVTKVKPTASRNESPEMYLLANGYDLSKHKFVQKVKQEQKKIAALKTPEDIADYEQQLSQEGKELAENILRDMRRTGEEITQGQKKALRDLGVEESDLNDPPMTKRNYIETLRKRQKHRFELDEEFRKKFGIKKSVSFEEQHAKSK